MKVKLNDVCLFFPDLFDAVQFKGEGNPRYGCNLGLPKGGPQEKLLEDAIRQVATEAWKDKAAAMVKGFRGNSNKFCLIDGDAVTYDGAQGLMVLSARRPKKNGRPVLYDRRKNPLTEDDGTLYSGCYVNVMVDVWAQVKDYPGIRCQLLGVQFYRDGDAFSGGARVSDDDFEDLGVTEEAGEEAAWA